MEIDLDELKECKNCGIIFNKIIRSKEINNYGDRKGKCPLCNEEFFIWSNEK